MELVSKSVPYGEITIAPIGDLQWGADGSGKERLKRYIDKAFSLGNPYFIGMGDMIDFASPSNRGVLLSLIKNGTLYDISKKGLDDYATGLLVDVMHILEPTKGRWLGMVRGHHYWAYDSGQTSDTKLCEYLETSFLGDSAMVRVEFDIRDRLKYKNPSITLWVAHGRGSGTTQASPLNFLENKIIKSFEADIYLIGHQHKSAVAKMDRIYPRWANKRSEGRWGEKRAIVQVHDTIKKTIVMGCTGGYLEGYMVGSKDGEIAGGNYIEKGLLPGVAQGGIYIMAKPAINHGETSVNLDVLQ